MSNCERDKGLHVTYIRGHQDFSEWEGMEGSVELLDANGSCQFALPYAKGHSFPNRETPSAGALWQVCFPEALLYYR